MSDLELGEVRALVALFGRSDLRDLWVGTPGWSVFVAKPGGAQRPGARAAEPGPAATVVPEHLVTAPHLGVVAELPETASPVVAGERIGVLRVLDERRPVLADRSGTVIARLAQEGTLVQYGEPLVRIA